MGVDQYCPKKSAVFSLRSIWCCIVTSIEMLLVLFPVMCQEMYSRHEAYSCCVRRLSHLNDNIKINTRYIVGKTSICSPTLLIEGT